VAKARAALFASSLRPLVRESTLGPVTDPRVLGPDLAPTPFTAEEIRAACPAGRTIGLLVEAAGEAPSLRFTRFITSDESGTTMERGPLAGGDVTRVQVTWGELQAHAAFPSAATTVVEESIELPLGELECLRYTVKDGDGEDVFWFATALPGMPVRSSRLENGRVVTTTTMISNTVDP
jgi:hypothetical protein